MNTTHNTKTKRLATALAVAATAMAPALLFVGAGTAQADTGDMSSPFDPGGVSSPFDTGGVSTPEGLVIRTGGLRSPSEWMPTQR